jgi:mycofactocin glycosyltransferase
MIGVVGSEHSDIAPTAGRGVPYPPELCGRSSADIALLAGSDGEPVLLGGSPLRLLRLRDRSLTAYRALAAGQTVRQAAAASGASIRSVGRLARDLLDRGVLQSVPSNPSTIAPIPFHDVSLVIPVYNRGDSLRRLLGSIGSLHTKLGEVIVVNDGSTDDTADIAAEIAKQFPVRVLHHPQPLGPAAARNAGIAVVNTRYVACLDSDCVASPTWLDALLPHFCDPAIAFVAPRIVGLEIGRHPSILQRYEHIRSPLDLGAKSAQITARTSVAYVPAAAFVAEVASLRQLGGFDTQLLVGEDVDLLWRLHNSGRRARYEPTSQVAHDHRVAWRAFIRRRFDYGTSAAALDARHPGQVAPLAVSGWSALAWASAVTATPAGLAMAAGIGASTTALLPKKLSMLAKPWPTALSLAGRGHIGAGRQLGSALWRTYLPVALLAMPLLRAARIATIAAAILPNVADWRSRPRLLDPIRYVGIRMLDDAAYCAGTWVGAWRARSLRALLPDFTSWPGRRVKPTTQAETQ